MTTGEDTLIGSTLAGRYALERLASQELLGRVYAGKDVHTGTVVSVKVLYPHLVENAEKFQRFGREMTATSMVRHPNTVQVLDYGEDGPYHFLVMEFLNARSLHEELAAHGQLEVDRVVRIVAQVASALEAAHKEGIIHRALAPHNILLLNNAVGADYVKIRDWGLAKLDEDEEEGGGDGHGLTQAGARVGNVAYMAPEYIDEQQVTASVDLYALGCIAFQMLAGETPFTGRAGEILDAHISLRAPLPSSKRPGLPTWLDIIVLDLLEKDPRDRPLSGGQVVQQLKAQVKFPLGPPKLSGLDGDAGGVVLLSADTARSASLVGVGALAVGVVLALGLAIGVGVFLALV